MVADPVGDMLIRVKNAGGAEIESVLLPYSKLKFAVAMKLLDSGYVKSVAKKGKKAFKMEIGILYGIDGKPKIKDVKRISKLSRRVYFPVKSIRPVRRGYGMMVLSTPKGVLTGEEARKENVGGEALFQIW